MLKETILKRGTTQPWMSLSAYGTIIPLTPPVTETASFLTSQFPFQVFVSKGDSNTHPLPVSNPGGVLPLDILPEKVIVLTPTSGGDGGNDRFHVWFIYLSSVCVSVSLYHQLYLLRVSGSDPFPNSYWVSHQRTSKTFHLLQRALGNLMCSFPTLSFFSRSMNI